MGSIVVGLEVGTSKVCAAVGDLSPSGAFSILGIGQCRSRGVRKGEIVDPSKAMEDVRVALSDAEHMADVEIRSVYLGVTGSHISSYTNRGIHPVLSDDRTITEEDLQDAVRNARMTHLGPDFEALHTVRQAFAVDDMMDVENPVDMVGSRVEARVHFIYGHLDRLRNARRVLESLQLQVEQTVFGGLASGLAVLTQELKDVGALVVDLGAGTTEYVLFSRGILRDSGVIAVGGDHVSNDLAIGLKLPLGRAEALKIEHGSALVEEASRGHKLTLAGEVGMSEKVVSLENMRRIQSMRVEETLELVARELGESLELARAGVFLSGGGARMDGIQTVAERVFQLPVHIARTQGVSGSTDALDHPEFATSIGLAIFGGMQTRRRPPGWFGSWFRGRG